MTLKAGVILVQEIINKSTVENLMTEAATGAKEMMTEAATGAKEMMSTAENGMKEIATEISSAFHE